MKLNYFLITIFLIFGCIQLDGMSYWERAKSCFNPSISSVTTQNQIKEFNDLLANKKYELALTSFQSFYPQANIDQKKEFIKIITDQSVFLADTNYSKDFIQLFLRPAFNVEPHLYNIIYNRIFSTYFGEPLTYDFQKLYINNINKIVTSRFLPALKFLIDISKKNFEESNQEILKLFLSNLNILEGLTTFNLEYQIAWPALYYLYREISKKVGPETFNEYLANHIDSIIKNNSNGFIDLFKELYGFTNSQQNVIADSIANNVMLFNQNPRAGLLLSNNFIPWKDFQVNKMISTALSNVKKINPKFAEALLLKSQNHQLAQAIISTPQHFPEYLLLYAKDILEGNIKNSPTLLHMQRYFDTILSSTFHEQFIENSELKDLYSTFRKKEQELNKQGYYTFVHGQQRRFYFPERLYTHLWGLRQHQSVNNFLFAHVKDLIDTPETLFEEDIARKTIHMAGTIQESESREVDIERRKKVLFMNYTFFANTKNLGSNSADYVIKNKNAPAGREIEISIKEPFTLLGYDWIYKKYQQEIEQLTEDYANLSGYGNMLLIAVPKDKIYKYVYICKSGGLQQPLMKKDGTQITDIRIAMETLLKNPEQIVDSDQIEFCLIMTQIKGGLDPSSGIQIYPLLSGDPEKLKALQAREKILLDKITADVKEAEKQQALERAAKITGHVTESAEAK